VRLSYFSFWLLASGCWLLAYPRLMSEKR